MLSAAPSHVRFVAIDFKKYDLASSMSASGYRGSARALIVWDGVTNYLTDAAVDATLRWCARASPGSLVLFTCVHRDVLTRPSAFVGTKNLFASLEKAGERFTFGLEPSELPAYLAERGLRLESDVGAGSIGSATTAPRHAACAGTSSTVSRWHAWPRLRPDEALHSLRGTQQPARDPDLRARAPARSAASVASAAAIPSTCSGSGHAWLVPAPER